MTETPRTTGTPGTNSFAWQTSDEMRDEERTFERNTRSQAEYRRSQAGWAVFAATMVFMAAGFQLIDGLTAFFRSGTYVVGEDHLLVNVDYSVWGWIHVTLAVIATITAVGLMGGHMWARVLGVGIAWLSMITNLVFIPAYPFLSVMVVVLDVLIIYAITVHGGALRDDGI